MKMIDKRGIGTELYYFVDAMNDDDLPDGAWWAMLEEGVRNYNSEYGTNYDPHEAVHRYLQARDKVK